MLSKLDIKIASIKETRSVKNIPNTINVEKIVYKIINKYYPRTDLSQIRIFHSGKIIDKEMTISQLTVSNDIESMVFVEGKIIKKSRTKKKSGKSELSLSQIWMIIKNYDRYIPRVTSFLSNPFYYFIVMTFFSLPIIVKFLFLVVICRTYFKKNKKMHKAVNPLECIFTFLYLLTPFWDPDKFRKKYSV